MVQMDEDKSYEYEKSFNVSDALDVLIITWLCICLFVGIIMGYTNGNFELYHITTFVSFVYIFFIRSFLIKKK